MFNKKELYGTSAVFTSAALILSSCAAEVSPVNINVANAGNLEVFSGVAINNLNVIKNVCKEIPGYLHGTEQEIQFTNSSGKLEGWAFCNDGNKTWVAGNQRAGENPTIIKQELVYKSGDNNGKQIEELGYVTDSGESKPIYMKVDGVPYIFSADGISVEVKNGKSSMDRFIEMATYSNASALGLPTQRPITAEDFTATPQFTLTPEATATLEPTATPDRYASYTVENLTRIPKSEAEIATSCVEVASPIDNWDQYSKDMDKVLAVFPEIMKDYNGPYLSTREGQIAIDIHKLLFSKGAPLVLVACMRYRYKDQWVMQSLLAARDNSKFVPFSLAFNPHETYTDEIVKTKIDDILPLFPLTMPGDMSTLNVIFNKSATGDPKIDEVQNNDFVNDFFARSNNGDYAQELWKTWFANKEVDSEKMAKNPLVVALISLPHTNDYKLIK